MSNERTVEQRLNDLEQVLRTVIVFNMNAASVLGRRLSHGNDPIAQAIAQDLRDLKLQKFENIDKALHDQYADSLALTITGRA